MPDADQRPEPEQGGPASEPAVLNGLASSHDRAARRGRMREFQDGLMERMRLAQSGVDTRIKRLAVQAGSGHWLIDLPDAGELVPLTAITPVPLTHDWFLGMTNIRGNLVSVIDFSRFEGGPATALGRDCRILAFAPALSHNSAILVSRVLGLHDVANMTPLPDRAGEDGDSSWSSEAWTDGQGQLWNRLDLSRVVRDPRFLNVGI